jgi:hypothetical protein
MFQLITEIHDPGWNCSRSNESLRGEQARRTSLHLATYVQVSNHRPKKVIQSHRTFAVLIKSQRALNDTSSMRKQYQRT